MIQILQGDCNQLIKNISDKSIDLVIIDPPYETSATGGGGCFGGKHREYYDEIKDMSCGIENTILDELCRVMKRINIYIWCNKKQINQFLQYFTKKDCSFEIITWNKTNPIPACSNTYLRDTEYLLFFRERGVKLYGDYYTKKHYYVQPINTSDKKMYNHPTVKPLNIIRNIIINSSKEGDLILDCYAGTGTTGVASKKLSRNCILIEKEDKYIQIINKRMEEL